MLDNNIALNTYSSSNSPFSSHKKYRNFFLVVLLVSGLIVLCLPFINLSSNNGENFHRLNLNDLNDPRMVQLRSLAYGTRAKNSKCTYWDCFNVYLCGCTGHERIAVYVYPLKQYFTENGKPVTTKISKEFYDIVKSIVESKYYTSNPHEACLFIPFIDTLNEDILDGNLTSRLLNQLPRWSNGENHLLFNMLGGTPPNYSEILDWSLGNAMIAAAGFNTYNFRRKFDISLPTFSPLAKQAQVNNTRQIRNWKVIASQIDIDPYFSAVLQQLSKYQNDALLLLDRCSPHIYTKRCEINSRTIYEYPQVLRESTFCLVFRGKRMSQFILSEAMAANCIPVIVMDGYVMPFHEIIDWNRAAIFIMEANLNTLMDVIDGISDKKIVQMRNSVIFLYRKYFSSMGNIAINTLDIIQDRVFPHRARTYDDLNLLPSEVNYNPLYFPTTAPKATGFTAVILTYDRIQSLFILIERLVKVPSLTKIVVVWNNKKKDPPALSEFPIVSRPISIIKTQANKLSNRFYPYKEIETEAVLHIDDDIVMLTSDEIEFAFEVWREFPDRIVGFPSRTHFWDNITNTWKYESEWLNEISMVLTGAAFLHKYWSYLYTYKLPEYIRAWVDNNMNCEDIAMNFLVANVTNKPPIKVTPRKKFKCPECASNEMLSADIGHMVARSQCVDRFAQIFRRMPLKLIEFRADPVLFKDSFPEKLKRFNNIGSL
ncbi:exostosin-2 isoform X1 [Anthonomus grandis grandis]|uniref:exostosin-2 isoform X1 n=1 Tax=Anthonomus grandis grandis TaxID=2921223 RepID=UPI0021664B1F|nr:exostosin-2 isoform X1 [Anthonomus grandis grandis]